MLMVIRYVQRRGNSWRYRRKVPPSAKSMVGKGEIVFPLGASEKEALRNYPHIHAQAERMLSGAAPTRLAAQAATPWELHKAAIREATRLGFNADWRGWQDVDDLEGISRDVTAEQVTQHYPRDEEDNPVGLSPSDLALIKVIRGGAATPEPAPTLQDAIRVYTSERVGDDHKKLNQLEHVSKLVSEVVPLTRPLSSLRRADAREVRDNILNGRTVASTQRYLNVVRAIINLAIREFDLAGINNPFDKLPVGRLDQAEPDKSLRSPFPEAELRHARARVMSHATIELQQIWRILEFTGCRLAEISGIRVEDVVLDHAIPHIKIVWHDQRRIKTAASHRWVPLIDDGLKAAQEAVQAASSTGPLFPSYCRDGGSDAASAALGKHVRASTSDLKVVTHSLRHRVKDLLILAGVSTAEQEFVLGHTSGKVSEVYGGNDALLRVTQRALVKAFEHRGDLSNL
ncbi:site-specific integrase [Mariluticola halotolerans]|uniref:site-specific integrase n=1 Tax=Mariluticola halotolerans TaxID=2909283 RepID=UPI0026E2948F|nr:site-specific integrase [Mariluticola halotolerans]UJQ95082.1 tyrosine-type recombinase/integrase [Mariluticola halotolerans]